MPTILFPTIAQSKCIQYTKKRITGINLRIFWTGGNVQAWASVNGNLSGPGDWEEITGLESGVITPYTFTSTGGYLYLKILKDYDAIIYEPQDDDGEQIGDAITCEIIEDTSTSA